MFGLVDRPPGWLLAPSFLVLRPCTTLSIRGEASRRRSRRTPHWHLTATAEDPYPSLASSLRSLRNEVGDKCKKKIFWVNIGFVISCLWVEFYFAYRRFNSQQPLGQFKFDPSKDFRPLPAQLRATRLFCCRSLRLHQVPRRSPRFAFARDLHSLDILRQTVFTSLEFSDIFSSIARFFGFWSFNSLKRSPRRRK